MCSKHDIAKQTVENQINSGKPFSYEEVKDQIISKGGILRVSNGFTLGEFIEKLEDRGIVSYNSGIDKFEINH